MTKDLSAALKQLHHFKLSGGRHRASFSAWTWLEAGRRSRAASVKARLRRGETIEAMVWRALAELNRRLLDGMPKPKQADVARRKLRAAVSPSRCTH